jgi:hypothetical protein
VLDPINQGIAGDYEVEEIVTRDFLVQPINISLQLVKKIDC